MTKINRSPSVSMAVLASVALLLAGCGGGSSSPGVAHLSRASGSPAANASTTTGEGASTGSSSPEAEALANAACMRSHGVPKFPDPTAGGVVHLRGIDPSSSAFQAAQKACGKLFPNGAKGGPPSPAEQARMQEGALKFSQCMRSHGVPSFPDPPSGSGGGPKIERAVGSTPTRRGSERHRKYASPTCPGHRAPRVAADPKPGVTRCGSRERRWSVIGLVPALRAARLSPTEALRTV